MNRQEKQFIFRHQMGLHCLVILFVFFLFIIIIIITILYVETDVNQAILQTILKITWSSMSSDVLARRRNSYWYWLGPWN